MLNLILAGLEGLQAGEESQSIWQFSQCIPIDPQLFQTVNGNNYEDGQWRVDWQQQVIKERVLINIHKPSHRHTVTRRYLLGIRSGQRDTRGQWMRVLWLCARVV